MSIVRYVGNKLVGLSSDTKPTNILDGATFYETDTLKLFLKIDGSWTEFNLRGYSGYSGFSGKSGYSGFSGTSGYSGQAGGYAGISYYYDDTSSEIGGYNLLLENPDTATSEEIDNVTVNQSEGEKLIDSYISELGNPGVNIIPGGEWLFNTWAFVDNATGDSRIKIYVYKRNLAGTETLLFSINTSEINEVGIGNITRHEIRTTQSDFLLNNTDRLVIKLYGYTSSTGNRVISYAHNGTTHYSNFRTPIVSIGISGISGYSGFSGKSGYSGFSGVSGYSGISGFSGVSGFSGTSGFSGVSGYSGFSSSGISGYSGFSGATGAGYSGFSGKSGYSGFSGKSGYSGFSGSGISGFSGWSGKSGIDRNAYSTTFTSANLSSGILTVTHNLGVKLQTVFVYDNNNKMVIPYEITLVDTNSLTIDFTDLTISGTWSVVLG